MKIYVRSESDFFRNRIDSIPNLNQIPRQKNSEARRTPDQKSKICRDSETRTPHQNSPPNSPAG